MHLAQTFMHRIQTITDQFKRFTQTLFECALKLFIDGAAHFFELFFIGFPHLAKLLADRGAQALKALLIGLDQCLHLCCYALQLLLLDVA